MSEAKRITLALRGRWHGSYGLACCPAHSDRSPSLSLRDDGDKLLAYCHAGCGFIAIIKALRCLGYIDSHSRATTLTVEDLKRIRQEDEKQADRQETKALSCWRQSIPIAGTLAENYLRGRGITCDLPETLRFHPACRHPSTQLFPALVAKVEGTLRFAVHRTYLNRTGSDKAQVEPVKAMLSGVSGGAVRICDHGARLVVCEGIETGLSLASGLLRVPASVWAALSTSGMRNLVLPSTPGILTIATDGDNSGRAAGNTLATHAVANGWRVSLLPAKDGFDWNDILQKEGVAK